MAGKGGVPDLSTIYVGDLNPEVTETHLHEKFTDVGPVAGIHVCRDSVSRRSLGYAYVNFFSKIDAQQAIDKYNYSEIRGRPCRIMWSKRERPFKASPDANIFVKNLDDSIDSKALSDTFSMFGAILSCKVSTGANGTSRGYGFVQYESEDAARQAIERVNGMEIAGKKVFVGPFKKREQQQDSDENSLYVRNIPQSWEDADILKVFEECGELTSHLFMNDLRAKKRHGFLNFKDPEAAKVAIEKYNGYDTRTPEEKAEMDEAEKTEAENKEAEKKEEEKDEKEEEAEGETKPEASAEETAKEAGKAKVPSYCLVVGKAKSKAERDAEIKGRNEKKEERFQGIKLHVRSLPTDMKDSTLRELFEPFGTVTDVKVVQDRETGVGKGYGFVRMSTAEEAEKAVEGMNNKDGFQVSLAPAKGEGPREAKGERKGKGKGDGKGKGKGKGKDMYSQPSAMPAMYPAQQPMMGMPMMGMPGMYPMMPMGFPQAGIRPGMPLMPGMPVSVPLMPATMPRPLGPPAQMPLGKAPSAALPVPAAGMASPLNANMLAQLDPTKRKQVLGEHLFPQVARLEPQLGGKITGMLLEMNEQELLTCLQSPPALQKKVSEALTILRNK
jgi:polyadenylate-binding protein